MPRDAPSEVDVVALAYFLAPSLRGGQVIADPTGQLRHLEAHISPRFEQPDAVGERIEDGLTRVTRRLSSLDPQAPWHEQVIAWSSPASLPTRVPLVAFLQTPTARRRSVAARAVLTQVGALAAAGLVEAFLPVALGLTTTALGTLLPVLREEGLLRGRLGRYLLAAAGVSRAGA